MTNRVRMGVVGLGQMGRNHMRVMSQSPQIHLVGGVDPVVGSDEVPGGSVCLRDLQSLLDEGVEAVVVAVPAEAHAEVALRLAEAGVHVLIEKPIASDVESATVIVEGFAGSGLVAAVGHVERFNAANVELKRRLSEGELGRVISVSTERVGPYPLRVSDVGVVMDLATHDIDLAHWLGGSFGTIAAQTGHRMGRPFEDLVEVVGRLVSGAVLRMSVNWLTPTKRRSITVLGEGGAMVADLLSADLTYYANADVPSEWDHLQRLRGVSEGDMVRYALRKQEPLMVELDNFARAVRGDGDARIVTLEEGLYAVRQAERILDAATGREEA